MTRAFALILSIGLGRLALGLWLGFRPFDDTYITFRYALNLTAGFGLVYNIGENVLGTTSPLWAVALALIRLAHLPIELGALTLSLALDIATAALWFRRLVSLKYDVDVSLAAPVLLLCWFDYFSLSRSGMETSCFVFLVTGALYSIAVCRFQTAALFCALASLTRPEGALVVALLLIALWRTRLTIARRDLMVAIAWLLTILGGWVIFAVATFGSFVPQSVIAKAASADDPGLAQFSWANLALFFLKGQYGGDIFERTYLQLMPFASTLSALSVIRTRLHVPGDPRQHLLAQRRARGRSARQFGELPTPQGVAFHHKLTSH